MNFQSQLLLNGLLLSVQAVVDEFTTAGFVQVQTEEELKGKSFLRDNHCSDLLIFPGDLREFLETHNLCTQGHVVIQVGQ